MLAESAKRAASVVKPTEKVWSLSYIPPAQIFMEIPTHINKKIELLLLLSGLSVGSMYLRAPPQLPVMIYLDGFQFKYRFIKKTKPYYHSFLLFLKEYFEFS